MKLSLCSKIVSFFSTEEGHLRGSARRYLRTLRINFTAVKNGVNSAVKFIRS